MATEARYDPPPPADLTSDGLRSGIDRPWRENLKGVLRREGHWIVIILPLLATLIYPLRWIGDTWSVRDAALGFQPLVPLGVLYLTWAERETLSSTYQQLAEIYPIENKMRRGNPLIVYLGCLLLLYSYFTILPTIAITGFLVAVIGIVFYLYGWNILLLLWRPFLLALAIVPLPGSILLTATSQLQRGSASIVGAILRPFFPDIHIVDNTISIGAYSLPVEGSSTGLGILLSVLVLTFGLALFRKIRWTITLILLGCAAGIALATNIIRIVAAVFVGTRSEVVGGMIHDASPWIFVAFASFLVFLLAERIGPRVYRPEAEEE